jgi:steroid delta-isomerase-like uncharacterized protein
MVSKSQAGLGVYQAWERRDFDALADLLSKNISFEDHPRGLTLSGRGEVVDWFKAWAKACSDSTVNATMLDAGDAAVVQGVWAGTNDGPFGPFAATGKHVAVPYAAVMTVDQDGRVVRAESYYDQLGLLIQLGHAEAPGA